MNTEIKPFTATSFRAGEFVDVSSGEWPLGTVVLLALVDRHRRTARHPTGLRLTSPARR